MEWIGQGIGIFAMAFNILSYQSKSARGVIFMQLFGGALFAISFLMLGQYVGGILNIIAAIRAILFYFKKQTKIDRAGWIPVFIASYLAVYAATFLVFNQQFTVKNCIIECLPVLGMTATTLAFRLESAAKVRRFGLISSACWLIYNANALAIGAIICEVLSLGSIFLGMWRHDRKRNVFKNYIFDCGKVLVKYDPKELTAACVEGPMADHIQEVAFDRLYWDRLDDGSLTEADIKEAIRDRLSEEEYPLACAVLDGWVKNLTPVESMLELVKDLKAEGKKVYLLSNISKNFAKEWPENPYLKELFSHFDGLVCSGPLGITKPHKEIFEHLLNTYDLKAEESIFIDDAPINIEGAKKCGIEGYLFDGDAQKLRTYLGM